MSSALDDDQSNENPSEAQIAIDEFWPKVTEEIKRIKHIEPGNQILPLARIKKIMKLDDEVKMISAEAPLLFAKACEIFIHDLTLRAWLHTDDNKRRTLQRNDIAMAISKHDVFDFLIDIVPRDEIKPAKKESDPPKASASVIVDPVQYYLQAVGQGTAPTLTQPPAIQVQAAGGLPTQNIFVANPLTGALQAQPAATVMSPIQLVQQVITPTGEVAQIPVPLSQSQLNLIRAQMQMGGQQTAGQPIIIQAAQPQLIAQPNHIFLNAAAAATTPTTANPTPAMTPQMNHVQQQQQQAASQSAQVQQTGATAGQQQNHHQMDGGQQATTSGTSE